ncbi:MAG: Hsp20 family protein [Chitinivibrionales bacterium]|nr:Hsp20 family protein [Chitinivibrionales bacterium]
MALLPSLRRRDRALPSVSSMFSDFFNDPFFAMSNRDISGAMWPSIDIVEEKNNYIIRADVPGVDKKDIDVSVLGDVLIIKGEKREESKQSEEGYNHLERAYGSFQRSFTLPDYVDKDNVDAKFKNGVLELSLKKNGEPQPSAKRVEIKE